MLTIKEYETLMDNIEPLKRECKCGHIIYVYKDKRICSNCGKYVFKNKEDEFKYRLNEKLKKCLTK
jgi:ribosomal protein S27AE